MCLAKDLKCEDDASTTDNDNGDNDDEEPLKPLRFDKQLRHDSFNDDEDDCGDEPSNSDDVDGDSGRIPVDVVAHDILPGLCVLFEKNGNTLDSWKGHSAVHLVEYYQIGIEFSTCGVIQSNNSLPKKQIQKP